MNSLVLELFGIKVCDFIGRSCDFNSENTMVVATANKFNIVMRRSVEFQSIVNLKKVNEIKDINGFFESVNQKLKQGGTFVGCVETAHQRKKRLLNKYSLLFRYPYVILDFIFKRIFPHVSLTRWLYLFITDDRNKVLTKIELLGRLYYSGFKVSETAVIDNVLFFVVVKQKAPSPEPPPSYSPFFRMNRIGKAGKVIGVYKMRTMLPYSEYLQEYMYEQYSLAEGGKIMSDSRVTRLGRMLRRFWLDEIPMLYNWMKGDLKLVGVRPLSQHFMSLYTADLVEKRLKTKPGLIPPFYADLPKSLDEIMDSELKYLSSYEKSPFITDWTYLMKALGNIVFKGVRSA